MTTPLPDLPAKGTRGDPGWYAHYAALDAAVRTLLEAPPTPEGVVTSATVDNLVVLTESAFQALATKDPATLYVRTA